MVTRVCCGSQDPTDCWPGKAGTGSRQQQLPGGFPLYFPRPHSDYSVASHRSLVLDMRQAGPYEELEVGEAGAGGGGEVRHRGHCGHVLAGGLSGLDCRVRRLRAVAEAEWSSEQRCAIPEPEPHAATSTTHQVRAGGHSIHDEQQCDLSLVPQSLLWFYLLDEYIYILHDSERISSLQMFT